MRWLACFAIAWSCSGSGDEGIDGDPTSVCDGLLQADEGTVIDGTFDGDGDGFVDGNNPDCAAVYGAGALDCNDQDAQMHPEQLEVACNGLDDDCNSDTPDALDADFDGVDDCTDCDDSDPLRNPEIEDECWDDIDNNCDGTVDEGCGEDYNGVYSLDQLLQYSCAVGTVNIDFEELNLLWIPPNATVFQVGGVQPGSMDGTIEEDGSFSFFISNALSTAASCEEQYMLSGTFLTPDTFEAQFEVRFIGGFTCLNCENQLWTGLMGTKTGDF